ncbi:MAG: response regulator [Kiloniellaceae bacterium]
MTSKILLVDDDENILSAFERKFRKHFDMHLARRGKEGLEALASKGPFAVVVSDFRMPGLNGIQFLGEVKKRAPETVRIMLTGHLSQHLAMDAVDAGYIFRFHTKPCPLQDLYKSIKEGIEEHQRQRQMLWKIRD